MRRMLCLLVAVPIVMSAHVSLAFEECDSPIDPAQLSRELATVASARSPVRYHDQARGIRVITTYSGDRLIPVAGEQQQIKFVLFTPLFVKVACQIALATFLNLDGVETERFD